MKSLLGIILVVALCIIVLAGCTSTGATTSSPSTTTAAPQTTNPSTTPAATVPQKQYGGTFIMLTNTLPPPIGHPSEITLSSFLYSSYCSPIFQRLFNRTADYRPTPALVRSWEIAPDKKSITWHLVQGVKFQDGTPFDAAAVKYNLEAQAATPAGKGSFKDVTSYDIIDDYTLRVNLSNFSGIFMPGTLSGSLGYIASPTAMQKEVPDGDARLLHMVGAGPFKFKDFQRDVVLKFEKWEGYYEDGKPYLDAIELQARADNTTKLLSFKAGDGQYISDVAGPDIPGLRAAGAVINQLDSCSAYGLLPDSLNPDSPWSKKEVREAVQYAIDTESIANTIFGEGTVSTNQAAGPNDPFYVQGLERPYNPAKAKELLKAAGYPDGFKTTFYVQADASNHRNYATAVQSYLKAVGIDLEIQLCDNAKLSSLKTEGWNNGVIDSGSAITGLAGFVQSFAEYPNTTMFRSMARPAGFQKLIDATISESDDDKRLELNKELVKAMFDDCTYVVIYAQYLIGAFSPEIHDTQYGRYFSSYWEPENAWLSTKK